MKKTGFYVLIGLAFVAIYYYWKNGKAKAQALAATQWSAGSSISNPIAGAVRGINGIVTTSQGYFDKGGWAGHQIGQVFNRPTQELTSGDFGGLAETIFTGGLSSLW